MNREIKFRAWDSYTNKMYSQSSMHMDCLIVRTIFGNNAAMKEHCDKHIHIQQFTGLKDKNGKEIYEGDILYCHEYDSSDCGHRITQTFKNAVVGFHDGNYYYHPKGNMQQPHQLLMYAYKPEVIGNIYETPELLNKAEKAKNE